MHFITRKELDRLARDLSPKINTMTLMRFQKTGDVGDLNMKKQEHLSYKPLKKLKRLQY
jgi:hypothetical protein